jgi:hypothetical protein
VFRRLRLRRFEFFFERAGPVGGPPGPVRDALGCAARDIVLGGGKPRRAIPARGRKSRRSHQSRTPHASRRQRALAALHRRLWEHRRRNSRSCLSAARRRTSGRYVSLVRFALRKFQWEPAHLTTSELAVSRPCKLFERNVHHQTTQRPHSAIKCSGEKPAALHAFLLTLTPPGSRIAA